MNDRKERRNDRKVRKNDRKVRMNDRNVRMNDRMTGGLHHKTIFGSVRMVGICCLKFCKF